MGLLSSNVYERVDFYLAIEHLAKIADFKKNWTRSEKKRWINKHRRLLLKGHSDKVIGAIKVICRGRNSKGICTERNYFIHNQARMRYQEISGHRLPIGSGSMESGIRGVQAISKKSFGPNSLLEVNFKSSKYLSMSPVQNSPPPRY